MYRGNDNLLQHDLAIVVIKGMFDFAFNVLPVCVDWQNEFESEQLIENQFGVVSSYILLFYPDDCSNTKIIK